jgi:hypothetical protein
VCARRVSRRALRGYIDSGAVVRTTPAAAHVATVGVQRRGSAVAAASFPDVQQCTRSVAARRGLYYGAGTGVLCSACNPVVTPSFALGDFSGQVSVFTPQL